MAECVTGQAFDRAAGKLPARMLVSTLIKYISTLAPHLEAELDGDRPRFLTSLMATAHTVLVQDYAYPTTHGTETTSAAAVAGACEQRDDPPADYGVHVTAHDDNIVNFSIYAGSANMEDDVEEPPSDDPRSAMSVVDAIHVAAGTSSSVAQRRHARKKAFNRLVSSSSSHGLPCFDTSKEYTFEFYQHLLELTEPDDFKINMSRVKVGLAKSLNGQPIQIMSARRQFGGLDSDTSRSCLSYLWCFDLWHQALYPYAQAASPNT